MASNYKRPFTETQEQRTIGTILRNMERLHNGTDLHSVLLGGDPGVGKTTLIKNLSALIGIPAIVIEVPHISEEHIINIPFLYFKNDTGKIQQHNPVGEVDASKQEIDVTMAESKLYSQLTASKIVSDAEYLKYMKTEAKGNIVALYQELGGTEDTIPPAIQRVREMYTVILFIDELYRKTSIRVRNILRDFLDKKVGMHDLPRSVFTIYATNVNDEGIDPPPDNWWFEQINYDNPSAKDWFDYFVRAHSKNTRFPLKPAVVDKFRKLLKDEHIVHVDDTDGDAPIRISPRRWEQLILAVNASLPIKSPEEGRRLLTYVKNNFVHFATGKYSNISQMVVSAVSELITETSQHNVAATDTLGSHEWRGALIHAIELAKTMGEHRKYIPVVSGRPGVGKTSELYTSAQEAGLLLIPMKVTTLMPEDVQGMPAPKNISQENIKVKFSVPVMYKRIMMQIKSMETAYFKELRKEYGEEQGEEKIKQFKNQEFKYLLFLDELNRCKDTTFNALRRVILEKDFGPADEDDVDKKTHIELPKGTIIVGAINPTTKTGDDISQLTEHFRDVVDIIPSRTKWEDVQKFLTNSEKYKAYDDKFKTAAMNVTEKFINDFRVKETKEAEEAEDREDLPFYIVIAGQNVYVSPRVYSGLFGKIAQAFRDVMDDAASYPKIDATNLREWANEAVYEALSSFLRTGLTINDIDAKPNSEAELFFKRLKTWVARQPGDLFGDVFVKKAERKAKLGDMLFSFLEGKHPFTDMSSPKFMEIINVNEAMKHGQAADEIKDLLLRALTSEDAVKKLVIDETANAIEVQDKELVETDTKVSMMTALFTALISTLVLNRTDHGRLEIIKRSLNVGASEALGALMITDEDIVSGARKAVVRSRSAVNKIQ